MGGRKPPLSLLWMPMTKDRFDEKFCMTQPNQCWIWTAGRFANGYGVFWMDGKAVKAHRASWKIYCGNIPDDKQVNHKCRNRACVNPDHLYLGTQKENIRDLIVDCGGTHPLAGREISAERRARISASLIGKKRAPFSDEWKKNIAASVAGTRNPFYGKRHTEDVKRAISRMASKQPRKTNGQYSGQQPTVSG